MLPALSYFLKVTLILPCLLWFHTNFKTFIFVKNAFGMLVRIAVDLKIVLNTVNILAVLILPIHEHLSFVCIFFTLFFTHVLQFLLFMSFTFLVK